MKYPTTVIDNFFPNPDEVWRFMHRCAIEDKHPAYPGKRSKHINLLDQKLHNHLDYKICSLFNIEKSPNLNSCYFFQQVKPEYSKYDPRNCGMIHVDSPLDMGGVIYMDKDPDPDAGTTTYTLKGQSAHMPQEDNKLWWDLHSGKDIDVDRFEDVYDRYTFQFEEAVRVKAKYNRLVLFDGTTWHRCPTHGDKTRHTIVFFFGDEGLGPDRAKHAPPLHRYL